MTQTELHQLILDAVNEYVEKTEAWEDAQVVVDPAVATVELMEIEETDDLPDDKVVIAAMDLVEMTPDGVWTPDPAAISEITDEILED